ncbi:MAG: hypothetical protein ACO4CT_00825 [Planctomycetota bacterium]
MRRNDEHLIRKRSGAREWFRLTKLARSLALALEGGEGLGEPVHACLTDPFERALDLARAVHAALRRRHDLSPDARAGHRDPTDTTTWLTAEDVAAAAERALWVSGHADAAVRYVEARRASLRAPRRVLRARTAPVPSLAGVTDVGGSAPVPVLPVRLPFDQNGLG